MVLVTYRGKIANADSQPFQGFVVINRNSGLIEKVGHVEEYREEDSGDVRDFGEGCIVFPGMVDIHIHAREDETGHSLHKDHGLSQLHKEEYRTAGNAAMNGGVVAMAAMPNTPKPLTTKDRLEWHRRRIAQIGHPVTMINYVGIGKGTRPIDGENVPYKCYTGPSVGRLFFKSEQGVRDALSRYRRRKVSFHVEDFLVLERSKGGKTHTDRRPVDCVEVALDYLLPMIEEFEIEAKLCHWSTGFDSFDMIREHRERMSAKGLDYITTMEVSPEHLLFDSDMLAEHPELWPYVQMNPAIQSRNHRMQLIEGLRTGFIQHLATDHAPHTLDEKFRNFARFRDRYPALDNEQIYLAMLEDEPKICEGICCWDGTSGATWLDTYGVVTSYLMGEHGFTPGDIARVAACNPGRFINQFLPSVYGKGFGKIERGYQGSLTVINMNSPVTVTRDELQTKARWSPLEGRTFPGSIEAVIIRGEDVTGRFV